MKTTTGVVERISLHDTYSVSYSVVNLQGSTELLHNLVIVVLLVKLYKLFANVVQNTPLLAPRKVQVFVFYYK